MSLTTSWLSSTDVTPTPQPIALFGWDLAAWRLAEADPGLRSTVVGIVCVEGSLTATDLMPKVMAAVAHNRVLRSRVVSGASGPALEELKSFDVGRCVAWISNTVDVAAVAHDLVETVFDSELPLWRLAVVSAGERTYVVAALHHAIADGNGALGLAGYLFDEFQTSASEQSSPRATETEEGATSASSRDAVTSAAARVLERAIRDPQGLARDVNVLVKSATTLLSMPPQPHAQAMARRSATFGQTFYTFPKAVVRNAIAGRGVSQHDALVAVVCTALSEYHQRSGIRLEKLRINVPVALSVEKAQANQMLVARLEMSLDDLQPAALMSQSNRLLHEWRSQPALGLASELIEASRLVPSGLIASVVKKADATISSLRGVPRLGHIGGRRVSSIWPLVAPIGAAVSITSVGVGTDVTMCVTHDEAAVTDIGLWRSCLSAAMSQTAGVELIEHKFE